MDDLSFHKSYLTGKFDEIRRRLLAACSQLDEAALSWRPTPESNSVANLVLHIAGNIHERIGASMLGRPYDRDRAAEFDSTANLTRERLEQVFNEAFDLLCTTLDEAAPELLQQTQNVRGNERSNLLVFHQAASHFSEHLGQVLYIAKMRLNEGYQTTSI